MPVVEIIRFNQPLRDVRLVDESQHDQRVDEQLREAYERGLLEGERKLSEQLVRQRAEIHELKNGVFKNLSQTLPNVVSECQEALIALALQAAEKLVAGMPVNVEMVEASIREALAQMEEATSYTVELNPADLQLLEQYDSPLRKNAHEDGIELTASPEVARGGCVVRSVFGIVDNQRETKMALIRNNTEP